MHLAHTQSQVAQGPPGTTQHTREIQGSPPLAWGGGRGTKLCSAVPPVPWKPTPALLIGLFFKQMGMGLVGQLPSLPMAMNKFNL